MGMMHSTEKLLQETGRGWEILLGWTCALLSVVVGGFSILMLYIVSFWNPRNRLADGSPKVGMFVFLGALVAISVGFSVFAVRLLRSRGGQSGLMSPVLLRAWGCFFVLGSAAALFLALAEGQTTQVQRCAEMLLLSLTMACAAFVLAAKREQRDENRHSNGQLCAAPNGGPANLSDGSGVSEGRPSVS
jgi:hypothetical protein